MVQIGGCNNLPIFVFMILKDHYNNIYLFGASVDNQFVRAKVAWINKMARKNHTVHVNGNSTVCYDIDIGKKFSRSMTPMIATNIYLPIISKS